MSERVGVWSWQDAIRQADIPPGTKLLCLTLSLYMSSVGRGAWPSAAQLSKDSGMKQTALTEHTRRATIAGLLRVTRRRYPDGTLAGYTYHPCFPAHMRLSQVPADGGIVVDKRRQSRNPGVESSQSRNPGHKNCPSRGTRKRVDLSRE
jgi:hypothetical protein